MKLIIENLTKSYEKNLVLKEIDYEFESGKIYGLLGRNGAGKTTLFNSINEDIPVDTGKIYLENEYGKNTINTNDIGYVVSTPVVPEFLTGKEFLKFYLDINPDKNLKTIDEYFDMVKIDKKDQEKLLRDYSHGMKNKMQILINIIANPKVILLDEPLTSLDIVVQEEMKNLLKSLKKDHIIIFSTHILELALDLCDDIVLLNNKKLSNVEKDEINTKNYKEKIIKALKDESND
ncbi:MAG: ABC transporter ATP-binding protein [Bacilli bacterium]|nr:ABC transporter ATP-binding protein [Bacilli bacterium]